MIRKEKRVKGEKTRTKKIKEEKEGEGEKEYGQSSESPSIEGSEKSK